MSTWFPPTEVPALDTSVANAARRYNYWLGGKDNFGADRASADQIAELFPNIRTAARESRGFLRRAVAVAAGELGIRQFLDIGAGLPTAANTHEIAQTIHPACRIVYVDNDALVMTHARALLTTSDPHCGEINYLEADLRDPEKILEEAQHMLDLEQPVAVLLAAVLHFIPDDDDPHGIVARLVDALPTGSYLIASHATGDHGTGTNDLPIEEATTTLATGPAPVFLRSHDQFARFFHGLDLLPPGITSTAHWRDDEFPRPSPRPTTAEAGAYAAVAHIP